MEYQNECNRNVNAMFCFCLFYKISGADRSGVLCHVWHVQTSSSLSNFRPRRGTIRLHRKPPLWPSPSSPPPLTCPFSCLASWPCWWPSLPPPNNLDLPVVKLRVLFHVLSWLTFGYKFTKRQGTILRWSLYSVVRNCSQISDFKFFHKKWKRKSDSLR